MKVRIGPCYKALKGRQGARIGDPHATKLWP
jgi:hypothetical protein